MSGESILEYYSNITAKPVDFLWYPFLPCGKLALLQSDPGIGKTQLALYIASLLTRGLPMPDSDIAIEPANVIFQTAEDSPEDTIKPRLEALQADCSRIAFIKKSVTLQSDELEHAIQQSGARMVCFDPVQAFWGNGVDMNRANSVRPLLSELGKIAARTHCAILLIGHQSKGLWQRHLSRSWQYRLACRLPQCYGTRPTERQPERPYTQTYQEQSCAGGKHCGV